MIEDLLNGIPPEEWENHISFQEIEDFDTYINSVQMKETLRIFKIFIIHNKNFKFEKL